MGPLRKQACPEEGKGFHQQQDKEYMRLYVHICCFEQRRMKCGEMNVAPNFLNDKEKTHGT